MSRFFWVCLGGAIGTGARYLLSGWALARLGTTFPYGTLVVNMTGSFLLGALMHLSLASGLVSPALRAVLAIGLIGGFTTYSTFNYETLEYFRESAWLLGVANAAITVIGCLIAGTIGLALARVLSAVDTEERRASSRRRTAPGPDFHRRVGQVAASAPRDRARRAVAA
jgi:CrcB protein